ncbi:MAG TPA: DUF2631 domain-containing protein [Micromonosporaceae bacterium]
MAENEEEVVAPDQLKPGFPKAARIGAIVTALILVAMIFPHNQSALENIWLAGLAALLVLAVVVDWVLRKNGLRS